MTTRALQLAVGGITGRMGLALIAEIDAKQDFELVVQSHREQDLLSTQFDVFIDFTRPEGTMRYLEFCHNHRKPMVIGTTGLTLEQKQKIELASNDIPIVMAANFSIGITVLLTLLDKVTQVMGSESDIEIIEAHHKHKVDAPSGTALAMGEMIAKRLGKELKQCAVYERHTQNNARMAESISFTSIRAGDIVGEHTALFANDAERLEISHKASSRHAFALGALKAARWIKKEKSGLYNMQDVLGLI